MTHRYIPARIRRMGLRKELTRAQVVAAGDFVYFEEHNWLLWATVGTNFPRGFKVDTSSAGTRSVRTGQSQPKPEGYSVLYDLLIESLPFATVARRAGFSGSQRAAHREGRRLLEKHLTSFAVLTELAKVS